ncbi:hypothetical protein AB9E26_35555, partial [Rhizobium leguminosarum]
GNGLIDDVLLAVALALINRIEKADAGEGEPAGGRFLKPDALVAAKFKTSSTADIVNRFAMESSIGNFGVYFGDETGGTVHPIPAKDAKE